MAKNTKNDNNFWNLLAMVALLLIGVATIISAVLTESTFTIVLSSIASLIAFAMVSVRAFFWVKGKGLVWLIIYIVCIAAWVVGYGIILF